MTLSLRANLPVDDTDPNFLYTGDWQEQTGSSRQYNSNVHLTNTYDSSVSFRYQGQAFALYATTPVGGGNVIIDVSIDGGTPTTITQACGSEAQYHVDYFESPVAAFAVHTVVITNRGTDASFMFDNVVLYSDDINPSMTSRPTLSTPTSTTPHASPNPSPTSSTITTHALQVSTTTSTANSDNPTSTSSSSSQTSTPSLLGPVTNSSTFPVTTTSESTTTFLSTDSRGNTVTFTQTFTTSFLASSETASAAAIRNPSHIGTVMAGVFGGLAFLLLLVVAFLIIRRRKSRKNIRALVAEDERGLVLKKSRSGRALIIPQPFRLSAARNPTDPQTSPTSGDDHGGQSYSMSEKAAHHTHTAHQVNSSEQESSTAGPSSSDRSPTHAPLPHDTLNNRGFSSAAQPDLNSAAYILSHRRSTSMAHAEHERERDTTARPLSPTMSSMYMSSASGETYDAPPAYQPPARGVRMSDFKTRSQLEDPHTSRPPAGEGN